MGPTTPAEPRSEPRAEPPAAGVSAGRAAAGAPVAPVVAGSGDAWALDARRMAMLQAGLDRLDQGLTVIDGDLRMVAWNQAFVRLLEFPPEMLYVGAPFESFMRYNAERGEYGAGDVEELVAERVATARTFQSHATERLRPNGQIIAVRGEPLPHDGFVTLYTDVTEPRRYERLIREQNAELERRVAERTAELQRSNRQLQGAHDANQHITAALRRSEERLRLITDTVPAMIAYFDRDEIYRFVNKGYADWFGHSKDRVVGRSIAAVVPAAVYRAIAPSVQRSLAGQRVSYEYTLERDDGRSGYARSELVPEVGPTGEVLGCFVLSVDITELKAAQASRAQAQKMEAVVQLTGGLAHDFNNMLAVMIGNLQALRDRRPDDEELTEYIGPALKAAHHGAALIRRLLTFARQEPLAPQAVDVAGLIQEAVTLLDRSLPGHIGVGIDCRPSPQGRLAVWADAHQLENALVNLALNARDAMPEGGTLQFTAQAERLDAPQAAALELPAGDYVRLSVRDSGCGMDAATQARAFEPFFTTKRFGKGSGLGLSMVYGFAKQSGGSVALTSLPGQGTCVELRLPACADAALAGPAEPPPAAPAPDTRAQAPHAEPPLRAAVPTALTTNLPANLPATGTTATAAVAPLHARQAPHDAPQAALVLLVEDNTELRRIIRLQLVALGLAVIEAEDGPEALALLDGLPDLQVLISDIVMPGMDGRELCREAARRRPGLHRLLITGYADEDGSGLPPAGDGPAPLTRDGAAPPELLRKPFTSHELRDWLTRRGVPTNAAPAPGSP